MGQVVRSAAIAAVAGGLFGWTMSLRVPLEASVAAGLAGAVFVYLTAAYSARVEAREAARRVALEDTPS